VGRILAEMRDPAMLKTPDYGDVAEARQNDGTGTVTKLPFAYFRAA